MNKREVIRRLRGRRRTRGVTLIEILIVLAIIGLIAGGIAVYAVPKFLKAQEDTSRQSAMMLHMSAEAWRANHSGECPTAQLLKDQKEIAATSNINDAWNHAFVIDCQDDNTKVLSAGRDGKMGTADDIIVPEPTKETP